jgi:hypothetical protein
VNRIITAPEQQHGGGRRPQPARVGVVAGTNATYTGGQHDGRQQHADAVGDVPHDDEQRGRDHPGRGPNRRWSSW